MFKERMTTGVGGDLTSGRTIELCGSSADRARWLVRIEPGLRCEHIAASEPSHYRSQTIELLSRVHVDSPVVTACVFRKALDDALLVANPGFHLT